MLVKIIEMLLFLAKPMDMLVGNNGNDDGQSKNNGYTNNGDNNGGISWAHGPGIYPHYNPHYYHPHYYPHYDYPHCYPHYYC